MHTLSNDYEGADFLLNLNTNNPTTATPAKEAPTAAKSRLLSAPHWAVMNSEEVMTVEPLGCSEEKLPVHPENL